MRVLFKDVLYVSCLTLIVSACGALSVLDCFAQKSREKALRLHVDDSLITVNLCLGVPGFMGTELLFTGQQPVCIPAVLKAQKVLRVPA